MGKKFLYFNASTTGPVLVGLEGIVTVSKGSNTTVVITYSSGNAAVDVLTITHSTDTTFATVTSIINAINKAMKGKSAPEGYVTPELPSGITVSTVVVA